MRKQPRVGERCTVMFLHGFTLFPIVDGEKEPIYFPGNIHLENCIFQEAFYDMYTMQHKYAIQVPMREQTWTVHVIQENVLFV